MPDRVRRPSHAAPGSRGPPATTPPARSPDLLAHGEPMEVRNPYPAIPGVNRGMHC